MAVAPLEVVSSVRCFGGFQKVYRHFSQELKCSMKFSVYEPEGIQNGDKFNVLFYLSGLTCTEENFIIKSGFQKYADEFKFIVVGPDTSPRGLNLPGEKDLWNFGEGAGAYLDALQEPWSNHYRMYSYIIKELYTLVLSSFPTTGRLGIFGHSMGGHGAITLGLRNPDLFKSISAFAPITNPTNTNWGKEIAFKKYLGDENQDKWGIYDSCVLAEKYTGPSREILVDQGLDDEFLNDVLMPENLRTAISKNPEHLKLNLRLHKGYNHSYFFVSTFIRDHFAHHAKVLNEN